MYLSVVIPVYNEEDSLRELYSRLYKAMCDMPYEWEVIFVNDGSKDKSKEILVDLFKIDSKHIRVLDLNGNFGQHTAIIAGFEKAKGDCIITLDADLQNPPEEIHKLISKIKEGYDCVGGYRKKREDSFFRKYASKFINIARHSMTNIVMKDHGCMLRAYDKKIVDAIISCGERSVFIPALAYTFASSPVDIEVEHSARMAGKSKYKLYQLIRLNFDLITGFSIVPIQLFTVFGFLSAFGSFCLVAILLFRRFFLGSEAEGVFTLFAILFFLVSIVIIGIGILGEYIGRIYQITQARPKYIINEYLAKED